MSKQKLKILNHILKKLNDKFCKNKLSISKIVFFDKMNTKKKIRGEIQGYYLHTKKEIGIKKDISLIGQIENLCHELTHAYQHQIQGYNRKGHNEEGNKIYLKFLKETDRIIIIYVKNG